MKILFPYMARWYSLNWSRYHSLLAALGERGHEVHVLQPPSMKSHETNFLEIEARPMPGVHLHDVAVPVWLWQRRFPFEKLVKKALYTLFSVRHARRLVREQGITHVMLYNIPQAPLAGLPGTVTVFDYADDYMDMLRHELGRAANPVVLGLGRRLLDYMFRRAQVVTTVSNVLAHGTGQDMVVLPNGVSTRKVAAAKVDATPRPRKVVGFLGSFEYFIDFPILIEAARRLPQHDFLLVGKGRDHAWVEAEVKRLGLTNVQLVGGVPHAEIFDHIGRMDVCLNIFKKIPVSERACPIKLFEYAAMVKPIISTRLAELPYVDRDFLYYADTADELVTRIDEVFADPARADAQARRGYEHVMQHYTWEHLAEQFEQAMAALPPGQRPVPAASHAPRSVPGVTRP